MKLKMVVSIICFLLFGSSLIFAQLIDESDMKEFFPSASAFEPVKKGDEVFFYKAQDKEGKLLGVVFKASGKDYEGTIETLVGMLKDGTILRIKVINENDPSGLGELVSGPEFSNQFNNVKDLSAVQAVSGATISSQAVIDSVEQKSDEVKDYLK
jgi:electron transport complex protein RnfG